MNHTDHVDLLQPARLRPGGAWADLGAGSGAFTLALRELLGPDTALYAVDSERGQLNELQRGWRLHFGETAGLRLVEGDFTQPLALPLLDGVLMANSLHFYRDPERPRRLKTSAFRPPDKLAVLRQVRSLLKPGGALLVVEYDVDSGNIWVPYPISYGSFRALAPRAGFREPRLLATHPSRFLRGFYSALALSEDAPGAAGGEPGPAPEGGRAGR
jgi:ubiquinone/menaquinone biosynthesis C-methylase UbiE